MKYLFYIVTLSVLGISCDTQIPSNTILNSKPILISPDYRGIAIPWNIAPLNFSINAGADGYLTEIHSTKGNHLLVKGENVKFNIKEWKKLLEANKGDTLYINIYLREEGSWYKYPTIKNFIANEEIDSYISYRLIEPSYVTYETMTINQRNLTNFDEKVIYSNTLLSEGEQGQCINCHNCQDYNKTGNMQFHVRQHRGGTVIVTGDEIIKVNLKTDSVISGGVYPAWHPSKNIIVYSVNNISQSFHTKDLQKVEVIDSESDIVLYDIEKNEIRNIISTPGQLETFPSWSSDGRFLYYVSAIYPVDTTHHPTDNEYLSYKDFHYNIYRKAFNPESYEFTYTDTIFEASEYNKSATFPRESPDGRYLLFTLGEYGNFHIWHKSSDLYLLDMETFTLSAMTELNSPDVESYHSWSSNGRWIIFSSRRDDGSYTRLYIAYFKNGRASKPFILPQKNPEFYTEFFKSYNIPEFMINPVEIKRSSLIKVIKNGAKNATFIQN
jgi:hypothetical protein